MTDQEVLEQSIKKAIDNGFDFTDIWAGLADTNYETKVLGGDEDIAFYATNFRPNPWTMSFATLIYNHDFARALWGEACKNAGVDHTDEGCITYWQHHLQQMVIADDPIDYLRNNI